VYGDPRGHRRSVSAGNKREHGAVDRTRKPTAVRAPDTARDELSDFRPTVGHHRVGKRSKTRTHARDFASSANRTRSRRRISFETEPNFH